MNSVLKGIPISTGVALGKAYVITPKNYSIKKEDIKQSQIRFEVERFQTAVKVAKEQLEDIKIRVSREMGKKYSSLFDAHIMMLDDSMLFDEIISVIKLSRVNADYAVDKVIKNISKTFGLLENHYFQERNVDIFDLGFRLIRILTGIKPFEFENLPEDCIIIARDLSPTDTTNFQNKSIQGFITEIGSKTSHTAILARAFEIPAVVGVENITNKIKDNDKIIIDAYDGLVIVNPKNTQWMDYSRKKRKHLFIENELHKLTNFPAETKDGYRIKLTANIELPIEINSVISHGADGIGLYRTEFLYLNRNSLPSEEEQFEVYKQIGQMMEDKAVVIRTIDLGGDKFLSRVDMADEINPAMGLRAIRLCLNQINIFKTQLRAILRASNFGNLEIMFPMISTLDEIKEAKAILEEVKSDLIKQGIEHKNGVRVGMMIETPSASYIADILAKEVDFFSIGTNDLIQYMLAIDRTNENVAYLYNPLHPAILRTISWIVNAGHKEGIKVAMCGEMAGESQFILVLLGLGLDELSMNPTSIPLIKSILRSVNLSDADYIAAKCLTFANVNETSDFCMEEVLKRTPEEYHFYGLL
jgi:phosphoenolpyruvate-protein phosphotransferase (PTS system enzyme I)